MGTKKCKNYTKLFGKLNKITYIIDMKDDKAKGYEWIGDADETVEAPANEHSEKYYEPNRDYDNEYSPTKDDIKTLLKDIKDV